MIFIGDDFYNILFKKFKTSPYEEDIWWNNLFHNIHNMPSDDGVKKHLVQHQPVLPGAVVGVW
jgi:hypothetical protein